MSIKILFVIHKLAYGGAEKILAFLANSFSLDGFDVRLLTYEDNAVMQKLAAEVDHIDFSYSPPPIKGIRRIAQIIQVRKLVNRIQPDVVISFLTYPNLISIIALMGTRIPIIISERGDPYALNNWFTKFRDFIYNFAAGYVFQTNRAIKYYGKRIQGKAVVIPNPVYTEDAPSIWSGKREDIIVNVARFELKQKRQDILIKAFSRIANKFPNTKLILYGDGEDHPIIERIIANCHLEDRVILGGVTKNVYESIKKARLFVLSSDFEGIPNALIEAMSVGLPCVSTDCSPGGAAELITHMENGILVKAGCEIELAGAMEYMLNNPQSAEMMGRNAAKIIYSLNPATIYNKWDKYLQKVIDEKKQFRRVND